MDSIVYYDNKPEVRAQAVAMLRCDAAELGREGRFSDVMEQAAKNFNQSGVNAHAFPLATMTPDRTAFVFVSPFDSKRQVAVRKDGVVLIEPDPKR